MATVSFFTGAPGFRSSFASDTQKVFGRVAEFEEVDQVLVVGAVRQMVEAMFGSPGVEMPSGTLTARMTLRTLATAWLA